jgi:hypothetical protein
MAALDGAAAFERLTDMTHTDACHITGRITLMSVADAHIAPLETRCATALRLAMWAHHDLRPLAQDIMHTDLAQIDHIGSYNCRQMRTLSGTNERWSTHATADAIDIAGFRFADGTKLRLINDWTKDTPGASFLKSARNSACTWFPLTLSPAYNALHADHFHLQNTGWGLCR